MSNVKVIGTVTQKVSTPQNFWFTLSDGKETVRIDCKANAYFKVKIGERWIVIGDVFTKKKNEPFLRIMVRSADYLINDKNLEVDAEMPMTSEKSNHLQIRIENEGSSSANRYTTDQKSKSFAFFTDDHHYQILSDPTIAEAA